MQQLTATKCWGETCQLACSVYGLHTILSILMRDAFDFDTNHCHELNLQPYN